MSMVLTQSVLWYGPVCDYMGLWGVILRRVLSLPVLSPSVSLPFCSEPGQWPRLPTSVG